MKVLKYQKITFSKDKRNGKTQYMIMYFGYNAMNLVKDNQIDDIFEHSFQVISNEIDN